MFHEYALEPSALSSWDRARFFLDAFGPWKGRFLAEYPQRWLKLVVDALNCPDVEKKRIVERLIRLDKRVFLSRPDAPFDESTTWLENAEREHARSPFHAIVAAAPGSTPHVLDAAAIDDDSALWRVESGRLVSRDPRLFVRAVELLLRASTRIAIIDPYFRADQDDKTRPVARICELLRGRPTTIEVHFADEARGYVPCMADAERAMPRALPVGMKVTLHGWKERAGGQRLHNRYLLTDVGGVQFGDGIELGKDGQQDRLSILDEASRIQLWSQYLGDSPAFDPAGAPRAFTGSDVAPRAPRAAPPRRRRP